MRSAVLLALAVLACLAVSVSATQYISMHTSFCGGVEELMASNGCSGARNGFAALAKVRDSDATSGSWDEVIEKMAPYMARMSCDSLAELNDECATVILSTMMCS